MSRDTILRLVSFSAVYDTMVSDLSQFYRHLHTGKRAVDLQGNAINGPKKPVPDMGSCQAAIGSLDSLPMLAEAVKTASLGDGSIKLLIDSASFEVCPRGLTRLIMACRNSRQWGKALEILDVVRSGKLAMVPKPNFFAYSATISVCCKAGRAVEALQLLEDMNIAAKGDPSLAPDSVVYRLIISCCVKTQRYKAAFNMFRDMSDEGIEPDDQTLGHLLTAFASRKEWKVAMDLIDRVHGRSTALPLSQYNKTIAAMAADRELNAATEVFLMMQMMDVDPDVDTYQHLIHAIEHAKVPVYGIEMLESMQGCSFFASPKTFYSLFRTIAAVEAFELIPRFVAVFEAQCDRHMLILPGGCSPCHYSSMHREKLPKAWI